jgi:hypothetical protein
VSLQAAALVKVQTPPLPNVPPAPPSLQDTVPVGLVAVPPSESSTVTVRVVTLPAFTVVRLGDTPVVVERVLTVSADGPELVPWLESPE